MSFNADELIRVIRACHKASVTELKIGNIEVKFGEAPKLEIRQGVTVLPEIVESELKKVQDEVNVAENLETAEDRLDLLQIEDPGLYERLVIERELEDRGTTEIAQH